MSAPSLSLARCVPVVLLIAMTASVLLLDVDQARASSHSEAPFTSEIPKVDATDFYMFRSYEPGREDYVVIMANYNPLQNAYGGPSYFSLDNDALYEIHVDNDGDAEEDLTFQFRFQNTIKGISLNVGGVDQPISLINAGPIATGDTSLLNLIETYSVDLVTGDRRTGMSEPVTNSANGSATFAKPVDNIGNKSIPDYPAYAAAHIHNISIPGCPTPGRMFVGQRNDPFQINLGEVFDLVNVGDPIGAPNVERDIIDELNITSIILELPISCLVGADSIIGGWTSSSLRQARLLNPLPDNAFEATCEGGAWSQVSRLGMPLLNEVIIGLPDKDRFNSSHPRDDTQFLSYATNPTFPAILELLFGGAGVVAPVPPRNDLVEVFLTGLAGVNQPAGVTPSEQLRLDTSVMPTPVTMQSNVGVLGGDLAGFPNGRRPGDDVVDVVLRVAMGALLTPAEAPSGGLPFTDGATVDDGDFDAVFPFLQTPNAGSPGN